MIDANGLRTNAGGGPISRRFVLWMWVLLFTLVGPAFQLLHAQANAELTGTVTDQSGAAIAGAGVTLFRNLS